MFYQFTKEEIEKSLEICRLVVEHPLMFHDKDFVVVGRDFSLNDEMKETINLLENV